MPRHIATASLALVLTAASFVRPLGAQETPDPSPELRDAYATLLGLDLDGTNHVRQTHALRHGVGARDLRIRDPGRERHEGLPLGLGRDDAERAPEPPIPRRHDRRGIIAPLQASEPGAEA